MMKTILVVDDNDDDREALMRELTGSSMMKVRVIDAADADSCMVRFEAGARIDCTLLDYALRGVDGLAVLDQIRAKDPLAAVVMITGQGSEDIAVKALKHGAQDYLVKGATTPIDLVRAVQNAIDRATMARQLEEHRRWLESFAHILVHDLRAPLRTIKMVVGEELEAGPTSEQQAALELINGRADHMDALLVALRSYIELDRSTPVMEAVDLAAELDAVRKDLLGNIAEANGTIVAESPLPVIQGSSLEVRLMLQNLISNGLKYNRSVKPQVRVSATQDIGQWSIKLVDNGIGMPSEHVESVFEPFKRLHASSEFAGMGIGLAICRRIAERFGGRIWCQSAVDSGSTFFWTIPDRVPA